MVKGAMCRFLRDLRVRCDSNCISAWAV